MPENIPDYTNIKFSLADMNKYLKDSNIKLSVEDSKKLNTVFSHYDKVNEKGENKPDGILTKQIEDREAFMKDLQKRMPEVFDKLCEFFIINDIVEERNEAKKLDQKY